MPEGLVRMPLRPPVIGYTADGQPIVNPPRAPRRRSAGSARPVKTSSSLGTPVINKRKKHP